MLLELAIKDFAIIDELRVTFGPGFNALTGETGAGKSILIDALGAVLGERVGSDVIRTGARLARVEATFDVAKLIEREEFATTLAEYGVEPEDGLLIVSRDVAASGRSTARINGRASTAGMLGRIGAYLVDIHGQSEHLSLLRPAEHLEILDRYAGLHPVRQELAAVVKDLRDVRRQIAEIVSNAREREQRVDLLRFQVGEIQAAALRSGEEEELLAERSVLANAERLAADATAAYALMAGEDDAFDAAAPTPALSALRQASTYLADISGVDEATRSLASRTEELVYLLEDISAETRAYRDSIEANPARLEVVEERLDVLKALKRKYGATIEEVLTFGAAAERELGELTGSGASVETLREREADLLLDIGRRVSTLSATRRRAGDELAEAVEAAIGELNMGRARFAVQITQVEDEIGAPFDGHQAPERRVAFDETGVDRVEFLLASNAGEALKPLGKVASGGETARLMLALKSILSTADATATLVFDEVDVGVGGRSGQVVGEKLWGLSDGHQVLVITHLPQIAAFADDHFRISKAESDGRVVSRVEPISDEERIDELAAMLDGLPVTEASRGNALEMLGRVEVWKENRSRRLAAAGAVG